MMTTKKGKKSNLNPSFHRLFSTFFLYVKKGFTRSSFILLQKNKPSQVNNIAKRKKYQVCVLWDEEKNLQFHAIFSRLRRFKSADNCAKYSEHSTFSLLPTWLILVLEMKFICCVGFFPLDVGWRMRWERYEFRIRISKDLRDMYYTKKLLNYSFALRLERFSTRIIHSIDNELLSIHLENVSQCISQLLNFDFQWNIHFRF